MARATQALTTGLKVLSGSDVPVYTLEYLTSSKSHKQGDFEKIVVPYVELGRNRKCAVRFGDDCPTVSRRHAGIERNGNEVRIKNLSSTNPTLVNGRPVNQEYFLNSGDEIQLSMEGPRLRYNITATGTAKMGFTNRMNLVIQQAVKPYRTAVMVITSLFFLLISFGGYQIYEVIKNNEILQKEQVELINQIKQDSIANRRARDSISLISTKKYQALKQESDRLKTEVKEHQLRNEELISSIEELENENIRFPYEDFKDDVFFIFVRNIYSEDEFGDVTYYDTGWSGTAFAIEGGRLVTARHCIQGWRYIEEDLAALARVAQLGDENDIQMLLEQRPLLQANLNEEAGEIITVEFEGISSNRKLEFTNHDFNFDDSGDDPIPGSSPRLNIAFCCDDSDWAYSNGMGIESNLSIASDQSFTLSNQDPIYILGFSFSIGGSNNPSEVRPLISESRIGFDGVDDSGMILLTDRNFESGNSGGPGFVREGDNFKVIGIVSAGQGSSIGRLTPIGQINR